jgi:D-alanyl-D-alanine carboxypeptidase
MAIEEKLQALVDRAQDQDGPGAILAVSAPHRAVDWKGACGYFKRGGRKRLKATDGFRIASMSKTFTATLLMQLVERKKLSLDAPLTEFFPQKFIAKVHPQASAITLEHLLNHTAGLWDFALSEAWERELRREPARFRDPNDILEWAVTHGAPAGDVGAAHIYSDTGYVILGHILQRVTGVEYRTLCRRRIFNPLGMEQTWLEGHEEPLTSLSHSYSGEWDGLKLNGSADWAAGGHVSTVHDLAIFLKALFRDVTLISHASLDRMLIAVPANPFHYALGVRIRREAAAGRPETTQTFWGHSGHWGSFMFYLPAWRATVTGTVNRAAQDNRWLFAKIVEILSAEDAT